MAHKQTFSHYLKFLAGAVLGICLLACSGKDKSGTAQPEPFKLPEMPTFITDIEGQAAYIAAHFWDHFNFSDTLGISQIEKEKQMLLPNYFSAFGYIDKALVDKSITETLKKAEAEETGVLYAYFFKCYKDFLYDPNSPFRNEDFYITVLNYAIASEKTEFATRERSKFELDRAMKNRIGDVANDLTFTLFSGKTGSLHGIRSPYTLLMFYNPDCHTCEETINALKTSAIITRGLKEKKLAVVAFYPDEDLAIWEKHLTDIPAEWTNGYDKERATENKELYDLRAIPTLYLLDAQKRVLLKDAPAITVEEHLYKLFAQ